MTLTELLVAVSVTAVVVLAAFTAFGTARSGSDLSNRETWLAREISAPLTAMERVLIQQWELLPAHPQVVGFDTYEGVGPYSVLCSSDRDNDGVRELTWFEARAGELRVTSTEGTSTPRVRIVSSNNANGDPDEPEPLFVFFDADNNVITDYDAVPATAKSVKVTVTAVYQGEAITASRHVWFRNRR